MLLYISSTVSPGAGQTTSRYIYIYIYIYINALCQEDGGEGSEYITKREKGERGRRAESRK
jgi:hypothetical protein